MLLVDGGPRVTFPLRLVKFLVSPPEAYNDKTTKHMVMSFHVIISYKSMPSWDIGKYASKR
jgi:hypothetical protein